MRIVIRRLLPLALLVAAAFSISYAVAQAGDSAGEPPVSVPGVAPEPVSEAAAPKVKALGRAAALPALRRPPRPRPAAPAAPAPAPVAPSPQPVTPAPAPVEPAPVTPAPAPAPAPKRKQPAGKEFRLEG